MQGDKGGRDVRRSFRTAADDAGRPLGEFIARHCPEAPVGFLNRLLRKGFVLVDGKPAPPDLCLEANHRVVLTLPQGAFLVAPNPDVRFRVMYEDKYLAVVEKPAGVISEPGIGHKLDTLLNGLIARYGEQLDRLGARYDFGMVHRLDRDTSGLLVVARDAKTQQSLCREFKGRRVQKRYTSLLVGRVAKETGTISLPVGRERKGGRARGLVGARGDLKAITEYRIVERFTTATLVEASPRTGRWRQLRLHFAAVGHPVAGDTEHGDAAANASLGQRSGLRRMFLHAGFLRFRHPASGEWQEFTSPLPDELKSVLQELRRKGCT